MLVKINIMASGAASTLILILVFQISAVKMTVKSRGQASGNAGKFVLFLFLIDSQIE